MLLADYNLVDYKMRPSGRVHQRGVTLIELMIAVSLTAVITVGLMFALRTSVLAYEKTGDRLRANREQISRNQILSSELGGAMPVLSPCGGFGLPYFTGTPTRLQMISSYSIAEGYRGYPQILDFEVTASPSGGVRLVVTEHPYTGPSSVSAFCGGPGGSLDAGTFSGAGSPPFVLADGLASCEFSYHEPVSTSSFKDTAWKPAWSDNHMPAGVRVEMQTQTAGGGALPLVNVTAQLHVDRDIFRTYEDR